MNRVYLTVSCFVFLCAQSTAADILEGTDVKEDDFKFQVVFYSLYGHPNTECGGAILNEWYILTSATATYRYIDKLDKLIVYLGGTNIRDILHKRLIAEIKMPKEFVIGKVYYDVAIVRVREKLEFSANIQPITLPVNGDVFDGRLLASGFDFAIRYDTLGFPRYVYKGDLLHYHNTSVIPLDKCLKLFDKSPYSTEYNISEDFICTINNEGFSFNVGYNGNPLSANNILYGLASYNGGPTKHPNVYTKVFSHKKWIEDNSALAKA